MTTIIDPTGRTERLMQRRVVRLLILLAAVFAVGCGIGWLIGLILAPSASPGGEHSATTLPTAPPQIASSGPAPDSLAPSAAGSASPLQTSALANVDLTGKQPLPPMTAPSPPKTQPSVPPVVSSSMTTDASKSDLIILDGQKTVPPVASVDPTPVPSVIAAPQVSPAGSLHKQRHVSAQYRVMPQHARHHLKPTHRAKSHHARSLAHNAPVKIVKAAGPGPWVVQLGAFRSHDMASMLALTLQSHGNAVTVHSHTKAGATWYVVQTQPVASLATATATARGLAEREKVTPYVVPAAKP